MLVLVEKQEDNTIIEHVLDGEFRGEARPGTVYTIIDTETGMPPADMIIIRNDGLLEVIVNDHPIARLSEFFDEDAKTIFSLDGSLEPINGAILRGSIPGLPGGGPKSSGRGGVSDPHAYEPGSPPSSGILAPVIPPGDETNPGTSPPADPGQGDGTGGQGQDNGSGEGNQAPDGPGSPSEENPDQGGMSPDTTAPVITAVSIPDTTMAIGDTVTVTITVEDDKGDTYTNLDGTVDGFALSNLARVNATIYTAEFTVTEGGTDVAAGSDIPVSITLDDSAENTSTAYTTPVSQAGDPIDAKFPVITAVSIPDAAMIVGDTVTVTIKVADDGGDNYTNVAGTIGGFAISNLSRVDATTYTAGFTVTKGGADVPAGSDIPVSITLDDSAGNTSTAYTTPVSQAGDPIDTNSPVITAVSIPDAAMIVGDTVTVTIKVADDGGDNYTNVSGTVDGFALSNLARVDATTYTAEFTVTEGGTDVAASSDIPVSITLDDSAGNTSTAYTTPVSQAGDPIDANSPVITAVSIPDAAMIVGDTVTVTIKVADDGGDNYTNVSGTVDGFALSNLARVDATTYTAEFSVTKGGADVAAGSDIPVSITLDDSAGNTSDAFTTAISQGSDPIDANAPVITAVSIPDAAMIVGDTITATIKVADDGGDAYTNLSGTVGGFALSNLTRVDATTYTAEFSVTEGGTDVPAGSDIPVSITLDDSAGNTSTAYTTPVSQAGDPIDANSPVITAVSIPDAAMIVGDTVTATIKVADDGGDNYTNISGSIGGFALSNLARVNATTYTAGFTVTKGGTDMAAGSDIPVSITLDDSAGNTSDAFTTAISQGSDPIDANPPVLITLGPADDATNVGLNANLTLTFDESVSAGTGTLVIRDASDDSVFETIDITSGQVTGWGTDTITVNPAGSFANDSSYYVQFPAGAILDATGNPAAGMASTTTWNFFTPDTIAPTTSFSAAAYNPGTDTITLTGTDMNTLLDGAEDSSTDIKARFDWTKFKWDIDGDDGATLVTFAESDIASVHALDDNTLEITLTPAKGSALEATGNYDPLDTNDTVEIDQGFCRDNTGNVSTTDAFEGPSYIPEVTSVAVTGGTSMQNSTLNAGDVVSVTVTMSEKTDITGIPQLDLNIGGTIVQADYASGSGTTALVFTYTIQANEEDANGISVDQNSLALNGGTMKGPTGNNADLAHAAVADNGSYLVDAVVPTTTFSAAAYDPGTDTITLTGTDINTLLDGAEDSSTDIKARFDWTKFKWDIDGDDGATLVTFAESDIASVHALDDSTLEITLTPAKGSALEATGNYDPLNADDTVEIDQGFCRDNGGNAAVTDAFEGPSYVPEVTSVAVTGGTGMRNSTLNAGDVVSVTVTMTEKTDITGTPQLDLNIGGTIVQADYASGSGTTALVFTYTIQANEEDANGISVDADSLALNGGAIKGSTGNNAVLTHAAVADNGSYLVDAKIPSAPSLALSADTGNNSDGITHDRTVDVSGIEGGASWEYTLDNGNTWNSGTGSSFELAADTSYTAGHVQVRQTDPAGNTSSAGSLTAVTTDNTDPAVSSVSVPADGTYKIGDTLDFTVNFSETITLAGTSSFLTLTLDTGGTVQAAYQSKSATTITYRYTVTEGHLDTSGISVGTIDLNGDTITDTAGNTADTTLNNVAPTAGVDVDGIKPAIQGVTVEDGDHSIGDTVQVTITAANGETGLTLSGKTFNGQTLTGITDNNDGTYTATYTIVENDTDVADSGSVVTNLAFTDEAGNVSDAVTSVTLSGESIDAHTPTAPSLALATDTGTDNSDGITHDRTVDVSGIEGGASWEYTLNNGSTWNAGTGSSFELAADTSYTAGHVQVRQTDPAGNTSPAGSLTAVTTDNTDPVVDSVSVPADGTYKIGATLDFTVTFSENITLTGTNSTLGLTLDTGGTVQAGFQSKTANSITYRYTVTEGDLDADGISVGTITLGTDTIEDTAGNSANLTLNNVASTAGVDVDGIKPAIQNVSVENGTHLVGDTVEVTITAADNEDGLTLSSATFNDQTLTGITDNHDGTYTATYTVTEGDDDVANGGNVDVSLAFTDDAGNVSDTLSSVTLDGESIDAHAPALTGSSPNDDATGVALGSNIELTFSENIALGTGDITITDGSQTITIDVENPGAHSLDITGNTLTIDPGSDLAHEGSTYHVEIDSTAITDTAGNAYEGISDATTLNFETVPPTDTSIVVFDLVNGRSSDHSTAFDPNITYTIYIYVDSDSHVLNFDAAYKYSGAGFLSSNDTIKLAGNSDAPDVYGSGANPIGVNLLTKAHSYLMWKSNAKLVASMNNSSASSVNGTGATQVTHYYYNGHFARFGRTTNDPRVTSLTQLWSGTWADTVNIDYTPIMPQSILNSQFA